MNIENNFPIPDGEPNLPPSQPPKCGRLFQFAGRLLRHGSGIAENMEPDFSEDPINEEPNEPELVENYDLMLADLIETLKADAEKVGAALQANNEAAVKSWGLLNKVNEYRKAGHNWLNDDQLVRKGIDHRYGNQNHLYNNENRLSELLRRRKQQLDYAENFNVVLEFADEVDSRTYGRYISAPQQLGKDFNLPHTNSPSKDPAESARLLNTLPFVARSSVQEQVPRRNPSIILSGHFNFPTERVIGVESFDSWAGRGEWVGNADRKGRIANGKGGKNFYPRDIKDIEHTSRGAITDYAQQNLSNIKDRASNASIMIIRDLDGEFWGIAKNDGSHRMAAAKLRGELTVAVSEIEISSDLDMPTIPYSVKSLVDNKTSQNVMSQHHY